MASKLTPCNLCKKEISSSATVCPNCGEKNPTKRPQKVGWLGKICGLIIWGAVALSILLGFFGTPDRTSTQATPETPALTEEQIYNESCSQDWRKCKSNADIVNLNTSVNRAMKTACKRAAEKNSKFEIDWNWLAFGTFYENDSDIKTGEILIQDNDSKYANMFGGKVKVTTKCLFNLKTMTVDQVSAE
ncbi:hypothetical protein [Methylomonas sp. MK1]|uniref:hypothetical protein n=1 Tax=Methylomonas sp. MK1 TaxID=1131552 RepID=UPI000381FC78|nr:hypothetical protein [Methylomonas sp. MK1]